MTETPTSYSLLVMHKDVIYAVRDPYGNRPLCIGQLVPISKLHSSGLFVQIIKTLNSRIRALNHLWINTCNSCHWFSGSGEEDTEGWVVSSESCSFQSIGAKSVQTTSKNICSVAAIERVY